MDHKEAIAILISLLEKRSLDEKEKKAVLTAIGVLSWSSLAKSRIKKLKAKREQRSDWSDATKVVGRSRRARSLRRTR